MLFSCRSILAATITALAIVLIGGFGSSLFAVKPIPTASIKKHCDHLKQQYYKYRDKAKRAYRKYKRTNNWDYYKKADSWKQEALYFKNRYNMECKKQTMPPSRRFPGNCTPEAHRIASDCTWYDWKWYSGMARHRSCEDPAYRAKYPRDCTRICVCVRRR